MLVKIVTLFLIVMVALAMFGRLRLPKVRPPTLVRGRCRSCGAPRVGRGACPCGRGG